MPLFQDFGKKFTDAAKAVSKRTAEATEVVRLNGRMSSLQEEIERQFNQIGKAYYAVKGRDGQNEAADTLCAEVDRLQNELKEVREELDRIRNLKRCPGCGELQPLGAAFCASCGTKMPDPPPEPEPEPEIEPGPEPEPEPEAPDADKADPGPEVTIDWPDAGKEDQK